MEDVSPGRQHGVCVHTCASGGPEPGLSSDRVLSVALSKGPSMQEGIPPSPAVPSALRSGQGCCHGDWVTMVTAGVGEAPAVCCRGARMGVHIRTHVCACTRAFRPYHKTLCFSATSTPSWFLGGGEKGVKTGFGLGSVGQSEDQQWVRVRGGAKSLGNATYSYL